MRRNIYESLDVQTIVNASGPATRLSGAILPTEVAEAMLEASQYCVDIEALQAQAGAVISEITEAEAGYVTSGAAAALMLGTAACVTGLDPGKMNRLPNTDGMKNEVIIPRSHRNFYDHAIRSVGVKLVEVGVSDRFSGAGVRDTEAWEIADAITNRTAAIAYIANANAHPPLMEVVDVSQKHGVPIIVDAAAQLPPASNLKKFTALGADLVCFSGGKAIRGPQASGFLCGRRDLISAAALQHLDQDTLFELWDPPRSLIDKNVLPGAPQHGIGRPCKVGKEEIIGLITALRRFVAESDEERWSSWLVTVNALIDALADIPHTQATFVVHPRRPVPMVRLEVDERKLKLRTVDLVLQLMRGKPAIHVNTSSVHESVLLFDPVCIREDDIEAIRHRLNQIIPA
jgi:L-seryl-tRNA(Ser) seleniumtransferase